MQHSKLLVGFLSLALVACGNTNTATSTSEYHWDYSVDYTTSQQISEDLKSEEIISEDIKSEETISEDIKSEEIISEDIKSEETISEDIKSEEEYDLTLTDEFQREVYDASKDFHQEVYSDESQDLINEIDNMEFVSQLDNTIGSLSICGYPKAYRLLFEYDRRGYENLSLGMTYFTMGNFLYEKFQTDAYYMLTGRITYEYKINDKHYYIKFKYICFRLNGHGETSSFPYSIREKVM